MSDIKLFKIKDEKAVELSGSNVSLEKSLQRLIEKNLEEILGIKFLCSEYTITKEFAGRIDSLGLDENGNPVIIEYKRSVNENVINQGLFYLDWLLNHKADFELMVQDLYGKEERKKIDWSMPRLICIAGDFTKYDLHAVRVMNRNIELIRYKYFKEDLLLLELVNSVTADKTNQNNDKKYSGISDYIPKLNDNLTDLFEDIRLYLKSLGDDVQEKFLKHYIAYKRFKNFVYLEAHPAKGCITLYLKLEPSKVNLEDGFTRDVTNIGHFGTGNLEITIKNKNDFEKAKYLLMKSYEEN